MHWRKKRPGWTVSIAGLQAIAMILAGLIFVYALGEMVERREVVRQAPPYYQCNGPKETRHPRCDRD